MLLINGFMEKNSMIFTLFFIENNVKKCKIKFMGIKMNMLNKLKILMLLACILFGNTLLKADIMVIKTEGVVAYDYVIKGISQACQGKVDILEIKKDLSNSEELKNKVKDITINVVIAIGDEAANFAASNVKGKNILYSMVLEPERYNFNKKTTLGIDVLINIDQLLSYLLVVKEGTKKVGVIYNPEENDKMINYMEKIALKKQIQLVSRAINNEQEVVRIANDLLGQVEAIVMMPSLITTQPNVSQYISQEALKRGIPMIGLAEIFLQQGALFTVSINPIIVGRVLGQSACLIIKGNDISTLRIKNPNYSVISINLKLAELLKIKFPKEIINNAYKTIK